MTRGTTPTIVLSVNPLNLTSLKSIYVTIRQLSYIITKKNGDEGVIIDEHTVSVWLSQEETLKFKPGSAEVQMRGLTTDNEAFATNVQTIAVKNILMGGVIE